MLDACCRVCLLPAVSCVCAAAAAAVFQLGENIEVLLLPLKGLSGELTRLKHENKWAIDSRLLAFALGLDFAVDSSLSAAAASDN